jgi:hypothetical protein
MRDFFGRESVTPMLGNYTDVPGDIDDCLMTLEDFEEDCKQGMFIDYDGVGHPMRNGLIDRHITIRPSDRKTSIPKDAEYIVWYNR